MECLIGFLLLVVMVIVGLPIIGMIVCAIRGNPTDFTAFDVQPKRKKVQDVHLSVEERADLLDQQGHQQYWS